ncbi:hypothetical protein BpHYR1_030227 [Brachionus plicatilis]|uniref:Uncharacterized protein n=1 Tax=Brachionus plicatilis TaxID=10195 RepID=A0A3M7R860_BRAPC|nr:hypothetical protein BpHYR1_030227 [Brachionus plicatilis]
MELRKYLVLELVHESQVLIRTFKFEKKRPNNMNFLLLQRSKGLFYQTVNRFIVNKILIFYDEPV